MWIFSLLGCGWFVPAIALFALSVLVLVRSLTTGRVRGAVCGGCGYDAAGVPGLACPECGRDFRTVGIATRSIVGRHRGSMLEAQLAWIGVCGMVGVLVGFVVIMFFSWGFAARANTPVSAAGTLAPAAGSGVGTIGFDITSTSFGTGTVVELSLTDAAGSVHELVLDGDIDPVAATRSVDGSVVDDRGSVQSSVVVGEWLAAAGVDDSADPNGLLRTDVQSFVSTAITMPAGIDSQQVAMSGMAVSFTSVSGTWNSTGGGAGGFGSPVPGLVGLGVLAIVYVIGVVLIVRRRRSIQRLV